MLTNKRNTKVEGRISTLIDSILDKKMKSAEVELKHLAVKASEECFAKAMQHLLYDPTKSAPHSRADMGQNMGLNDAQMFNSLLRSLGRYFVRF